MTIKTQMLSSNLKTFSRLKSLDCYTYEWDEGKKFLSIIASEEVLLLSLGAKNYKFTHRIRKDVELSDTEIAFEYDTGDTRTCGKVHILIEYMRRKDKRDRVTVFNCIRPVPKNLPERLIFTFVPPKPTLFTASYEPRFHLSAYFSEWLKDEDIKGIRRCIERAVGLCLDPFDMV